MFSKLLDKLGLKESDVITDPESNPELRRLFETPAFAEAVENSLASQASLLQSYLKQSGVYDCNRVGIIDIGWRGTIQDNISLFVPDVHFYGMYLGLRRVINVQPGNASRRRTWQMKIRLARQIHFLRTSPQWSCSAIHRAEV